MIPEDIFAIHDIVYYCVTEKHKFTDLKKSVKNLYIFYTLHNNFEQKCLFLKV